MNYCSRALCSEYHKEAILSTHQTVEGNKGRTQSGSIKFVLPQRYTKTSPMEASSQMSPKPSWHFISISCSPRPSSSKPLTATSVAKAKSRKGIEAHQGNDFSLPSPSRYLPSPRDTRLQDQLRIRPSSVRTAFRTFFPDQCPSKLLRKNRHPTGFLFSICGIRLSTLPINLRIEQLRRSASLCHHRSLASVSCASRDHCAVHALLLSDKTPRRCAWTMCQERQQSGRAADVGGSPAPPLAPCSP